MIYIPRSASCREKFVHSMFAMIWLLASFFLSSNVKTKISFVSYMLATSSYYVICILNKWFLVSFSLFNSVLIKINYYHFWWCLNYCWNNRIWQVLWDSKECFQNDDDKGYNEWNCDRHLIDMFSGTITVANITFANWLTSRITIKSVIAWCSNLKLFWKCIIHKRICCVLHTKRWTNKNSNLRKIAGTLAYHSTIRAHFVEEKK